MNHLTGWSDSDDDTSAGRPANPNVKCFTAPAW